MHRRHVHCACALNVLEEEDSDRNGRDTARRLIVYVSDEFEDVACNAMLA